MKHLLLLLAFLLFCPSLQAQWLAEDVAAKVTFWLFNTADSTPKTGVTVTTITMRYVKSDGTTASFTCGSGAIDGTGNDCLEKGNGAYFAELTAAQLDTAGPFDIGCSVTGGVCAPTIYQILPTASYALIAGGNVASSSDLWNVSTASVTAGIGLQLKTNVDQPVGASGGVITTGTATAGGTNTITLAGTAPTVSLVNKRILLTGGTGINQSGVITAYNTGTKVATIQDLSTGGNWGTTPASGTSYIIRDGATGQEMMGTIYEGTQTFKSFLQYGASALFGKYNSSGGTFNFRDIADTLNRIVYTTTATSRSSVTLTPTP